ncbi:hypothetical protein [Anditalea andensis]|uniref:Uncharacterized protein n=1 Tax=Anditalea andensis TaxID=1048983 RepID=A0A074L5U7_9BACT|nr:hypothetical protein [Anditalea andensis]KEO75193.1 hypothetical protein EL17_05875 [Anditalea andensis]
MENQTQPLEAKTYYRLPLEIGTFCLLEETLNAHSKYRKPLSHYRIETKKLHFRNEILTLSVKLQDEPKMLVYLKVTEKELLVSCNFDTDQNYLSRYAYFTLLDRMRYDRKVCFEEYYWPDFFDSNTGRSKYLKIINDRRGLDIELKPKYPTFYKPGDPLLHLKNDGKVPIAKTNNKIFIEDLPHTDYAVGFCLADTNLESFHSNHYPFLVPFHGILSKDRKNIKSFTSFHNDESDMDNLTLSQKQNELSKICFKMRELAPIKNTSLCRFKFKEDVIDKGKQLFKLWHEAYELILSQKHTYFFHTWGMVNVKGKPSRSWMKPCEFKNEVPQLAIRKIDKGEYYQIELLFRINGKLQAPEYPNLAFFIRPKDNWLKIYLLGDFNDYLLISFFAKTYFKLAVLKCHYRGEFKNFMESLSAQCEIIEP